MTDLFCALLVASIALGPPLAEPLAQIERGSVRIVLYADPCALQDRVTNLPQRSMWSARGMTYEGCWVLSPFGLVVMYFDDRTVTAIPAELFTPVRGT